MSKITITVLGTAAGVPTKDRGHTSIYLSYESSRRFSCLLDCGEGTQRQMLMAGISINSIEGIFVTHWHGDHCLGIPGMVDTMGFEGRKDPLFICAPEIRKMRTHAGLLYPMGKFKVETRNVSYRQKKISSILTKPDFEIFSAPVAHSVPAVCYSFMEKDRFSVDKDKACAAGFQVKDKRLRELREKGEYVINGKKVFISDISDVIKGRKVVYSGDTEICDTLCEMAKGADLLIQDCTYLEEPGDYRPHKHASFPEIVPMKERLGIKKILLTHFSRKYDEAAIKSLVDKYPGFEVARDLCSLNI